MGVAVSLAVLVTGSQMTDDAAMVFDPNEDGIDVQGSIDGSFQVTPVDKEEDNNVGDRLSGSGINSDDSRMTSYNVCYTKLLRNGRRLHKHNGDHRVCFGGHFPGGQRAGFVQRGNRHGIGR